MDKKKNNQLNLSELEEVSGGTNPNGNITVKFASFEGAVGSFSVNEITVPAGTTVNLMNINEKTTSADLKFGDTIVSFTGFGHYGYAIFIFKDMTSGTDFAMIGEPDGVLSVVLNSDVEIRGLGGGF